MKDWTRLIVSEDATLREVIEVINAASAQIALVTDENNRLLGTITDGDVRRSLLKGITLDDRADYTMSKNYVNATPNDSREEVFAMMRNKFIHQIPIIDDEGKLQGLYLLDELLRVQPKENAVIIMAGGKGNRLQPLTLDCPKPMLKVGGKPMLRLIIENLKKQGFSNIYISINYLGGQVKDYFSNEPSLDVNINFIEEIEELGTAGSLSLLKETPTTSFLVMNGDVLTQIDYSSLLSFHNSVDSKATICVRPHEFQVPYGVAVIEGEHLARIEEKPTKSYMVNAGIYVLEPDVVDYFRSGEKVDMPTILQRLMADEHNVAAYPIHEYWLDIGHHDSYAKANADIAD